MPKTDNDFLLTRRGLIRALGAAAIAGLPSCSGVTPGPPSGPPNGSGAAISDGYADQQSYRPGDTVTLFLNTQYPQNAILTLYDAREQPVLEFTADLITQTPVGPNPWEGGFGYEASASFTLPDDLDSGVYLVEKLVPLIVKTALATPADIVIVCPTNTMAAYNPAGGKSMYTSGEPAPVVSFRRPDMGTQLNYFKAFLTWIAGPVHLPYTFRYLADIDLEDYNEISGSKLLIVIGHSEYWTRTARENFDLFVRDGGNALLLSGNTMWWQVRYSDDRSQMICYKSDPDPIANPLLKTLNWPTPHLNYPVVHSIGADFTHAGFGIGYPDKNTGFRVLSTKSPAFYGLAVKRGDLISMPTVEYDGAPLENSPVTSGEPQLNFSALNAYRAEIIGYEHCYRNDAESGAGKVPNGVATWIAYQKTATSGVVINGASTNWCSGTGVDGEDSETVRKIILNMIEILVLHRFAFASG